MNKSFGQSRSQWTWMAMDRLTFESYGRSARLSMEILSEFLAGGTWKATMCGSGMDFEVRYSAGRWMV